MNLSQTEILSGVWLTPLPTPHGHGLTMGGPVTDEDRAAYFSRWNRPFPADVTTWPDKSEVRFKIVIPSTDRQLVRWATWGKKRCDPGLFEHLNSSASNGGSYKDWWIYFGNINPARFKAVEVRNSARVYEPLNGPLTCSEPKIILKPRN